MLWMRYMYVMMPLFTCTDQTYVRKYVCMCVRVSNRVCVCLCVPHPTMCVCVCVLQTNMYMYVPWNHTLRCWNNLGMGTTILYPPLDLLRHGNLRKHTMQPIEYHPCGHTYLECCCDPVNTIVVARLRLWRKLGNGVLCRGEELIHRIPPLPQHNTNLPQRNTLVGSTHRTIVPVGIEGEWPPREGEWPPRDGGVATTW